MIRPRPHPAVRAAAALLSAVLPLAAQQPRAAPPPPDLRAAAVIRERPADPDLGIYVQIPDGGLLPKNPLIEVRGADGRPLESLLLWHTPADALGLVFRPPADSAGDVAIDIRASRTPPPEGS